MNGVELAQPFYSPPGSKGCTKARRAEPLGPSLSSGVIFHPSGSGPWGRSCRLLIPTPVPSLPPTSRGGRMCGLERGHHFSDGMWSVSLSSSLLIPSAIHSPDGPFWTRPWAFTNPSQQPSIRSFLHPPHPPSLPLHNQNRFCGCLFTVFKTPYASISLSARCLSILGHLFPKPPPLSGLSAQPQVRINVKMVHSHEGP